MEREPGARVAVRGDSGFAAPEVYEACEEAGATYVVRLKENRVLPGEAYRLVDDHFVPGVARTVTGEFMYQAGSWDRKRRVLFEAAQHDGQIFPDYTFVVTNSEARQAQGFEFYRGRGTMEQIVGEVKELARGCVCSKSMEANAFRCQLAVLAHCLLSWLRLLCLEGHHASAEPRTLLLDFVRVAARRVAHGRRVCFHFSSAYGWQEEFFRAVVACDRVARALRAA